MSDTSQGSVVAMRICVGHREPMKSVESADMTEGYGIEGDRHATSRGPRTKRQVLLMDVETLGAFGLEGGQTRENVTTRGIDLHALPAGSRVALGDEAVVEITGFCAPCGRMDEVRDGLREAMVDKRGMLATVVAGGAVKIGDAARALQSAAG